ncbi:hypothetical protein [uncultured Parolsenella sp.]|uniref:hypothetical protein n=1 Tax=uncultured Parolsenella sp. TaxID=2083008 RepID=UPI0027D9BB4D|nr:hypothetical protein [uncultured Parolsenella sp.]
MGACELERLSRESSSGALAMLDLMRSPLFGRLAATDAAWLALAAVQLGEGRAEKYAGADLEAELRREGVEVRRLDCDPPGLRAGWRLMAQTTFGGDRCRIDLYGGQLAEKTCALVECGCHVGRDEVERLHLAHEFFHVLEFWEGITADERLGPVRARRPFGLGWARRRVASAREAAAHAFARVHAGICVAPELTDYAVLVHEGGRTMDDVRRQLARAGAALEGRGSDG